MQPTAEQLARLAETADRFVRLVDPSIPAGYYGPWPHREPGEVFDAGADVEWPPRREAIIRAAVELDEAFPARADVNRLSGWSPAVDVAISDVVSIAHKIFNTWGLHDIGPRDEWNASRLEGVRLIAKFAESRALGHAIDVLNEAAEHPPILVDLDEMTITRGDRTVRVSEAAAALVGGLLTTGGDWTAFEAIQAGRPALDGGNVSRIVAELNERLPGLIEGAKGRGVRLRL